MHTAHPYASASDAAKVDTRPPCDDQKVGSCPYLDNLPLILLVEDRSTKVTLKLYRIIGLRMIIAWLLSGTVRKPSSKRATQIGGKISGTAHVPFHEPDSFPQME
jgi:hypothetical protein